MCFIHNALYHVFPSRLPNYKHISHRGFYSLMNMLLGIHEDGEGCQELVNNKLCHLQDISGNRDLPKRVVSNSFDETLSNYGERSKQPLGINKFGIKCTVCGSTIYTVEDLRGPYFATCNKIVETTEHIASLHSRQANHVNADLLSIKMENNVTTTNLRDGTNNSQPKWKSEVLHILQTPAKINKDRSSIPGSEEFSMNKEKIHCSASVPIPPPPPPLQYTLMDKNPCVLPLKTKTQQTSSPQVASSTIEMQRTQELNNNKEILFAATAQVSVQNSENSTLKTAKYGPPLPLPMSPSVGSERLITNVLRKNPITPPVPMKPLYWTRIVAPKSQMQSTGKVSVHDSDEKRLWRDIDETRLENLDEFTDLFSRHTIVRKSKKEQLNQTKINSIKVLDSKRSQNVGIFSRSLHLDFAEIEHAIYHCDTSVVSLETLQHIMEIKATSEELALIKKAAQGDTPLDYPEQFLLRISAICSSSERISCIVFQAEFEESCTQLSRKLELLKKLCLFLLEDKNLKILFSIILTLGNYMNGGNRNRGQADGFGLEILGKLKDVKSKDPKTTLLHYIVRTYIEHKRKEGNLISELILPIPEPQDVDKAVSIDFGDLEKQVSDLNKKLDVCKNTIQNVILKSHELHIEPFKTKMEEFAEISRNKIEKQLRKLETCRTIFLKTIRFFFFSPKSCILEQSTPEQFFELWVTFTNDFKYIWQKEIARLSNELLKKAKEQKANPTKSAKLNPGCLKERIRRLSRM